MNRIIEVSKSILADESGQELIEYALVAALVAVACIGALNGLTTGIGNAYTTVVNGLAGQSASSGTH